VQLRFWQTKPPPGASVAIPTAAVNLDKIPGLDDDFEEILEQPSTQKSVVTGSGLLGGMVRSLCGKTIRRDFNIILVASLMSQGRKPPLPQ